MELGEKLRQARLEAGISQRQLCEGIITRNMLSQIEHAAANPSMDTLKQLAARLGKPTSFFLEEDAVLSPNQEVMARARALFDAGDYSRAASTLEGYREPDEVFDRERALLETLLCLQLAEISLNQGKGILAQELLKQAEVWNKGYCSGELERRRLLLLGRIRGRQVSARLPGLDEELLLRAEEALAQRKYKRAAALLEAAEDQAAPRWNYLRGQVYLSGKRYREAAACFHAAEGAYACSSKLEICYRELGDFKQAYEYAKKHK